MGVGGTLLSNGGEYLTEEVQFQFEEETGKGVLRKPGRKEWVSKVQS